MEINEYISNNKYYHGHFNFRYFDQFHFEYLKTPIVNDTLYGAKKVNELNQKTICLQSYNIEFKLFEKDYKFSINQPDYFTSIMNM